MARHTTRHTVPFIFAVDESVDVGSDAGMPVDDADYQGPFVFTGTCHNGRHRLELPQMSAAEQYGGQFGVGCKPERWGAGPEG